MTIRFTTLMQVALEAFPDVFRSDFTGHGFALIQCPGIGFSHQFRETMVALLEVLDAMVLEQRGMRLRFQSLARFDQQTTTKFHLDGGPEESILMLGYEPTCIRSSVVMADYTRVSFDMGITPQEFMDQHNPMFVAGEKLLAGHIHPLSEFDESQFQIVLINNSRLPFVPGGLHSLGVLHQATILNPDPSQSRVINSTMLVVASPDAAPVVSQQDIQQFVQTDVVARKNYADLG